VRKANVPVAVPWGARAPILVEARPNARWSLDFVHDQFRLRSPVPESSISSTTSPGNAWGRSPTRRSQDGAWARELTTLIESRGKPAMIVFGTMGTEFTSNAMLAWAEEHNITWHFIAPGKPIAERLSARVLNGRMRDELLNENLVSSASIMPEPASRIGPLITNDRRPHSALGLSHSGSLRRPTSPATCDRLRNPRPAPPIACCSHPRQTA